jgi:gamma-glutamyl hercynylcysteine S-oxide synthase
LPTAIVANRALQERLGSARKLTDYVFSLLKAEAIYSRPVPERHRLIFYLGHLEAFDWNLIARKTLDVPSFHPTFDKLFEFGIDPPLGQAASDQPSDWPSLDEIRAYNRRVRGALDELIEQVPDEILQVALEHRLMHGETLAYLLHNLPYEQKASGGMALAYPSTVAIAPSMVDIAPGLATLGQKRGAFGWDNEFAEHQVDVPGFRIGKFKVTNAQYLDFVRDGAAPPHFWTQRNARQENKWFYRGMFSEVPLALNAPVYVTYNEASAYAQWTGKALLTEPQFHRAAYASSAHDGTSNLVERPYPWGAAEPNARRGNFDFHQWDPLDVDAHPAGDSAAGVSQLVGNGWEWTATKFGPFAGFEPRPFYPGYSKDFFDEEHYVLKGGSPVTAACMLRRSFRNWFRPNYPYVYASFRLVEK